MNTLIIGAGIAGTASAISLARAGISTHLVDARVEDAASTGAFLAVAPNGLTALAAIGQADLVAAAGGIPVPEIRFLNAAGREIGLLSADDGGHLPVPQLVRRGALQRELLRAARSAGVQTTFGARLVDLHESDEGVTATFADGRSVTADVVSGCDGVHSAVRSLAMPTAPSATYTGVLDCGAWTDVDALADTEGQRMVWGRRAFFGYVAQQGTVYWFSNVAHDQEPARGEFDGIDGGAWLRRLRALHADDPSPVPTILKAADSVLGVWPIYDLPTLPTWHTRRICLLGDAAHAASPSAGQGASLAVEDAATIAGCLRDINDQHQAFARFEQLRKPRADKIVEMGRRIGNRKTPSPAKAWLRDRLLPMFLRMGARQAREQYTYRVDFDASVTTQTP